MNKAINILKRLAKAKTWEEYYPSNNNCKLAIEEIEQIQKENIRLKKQLAKGHHVECSCSFCKPVGENND